MTERRLLYLNTHRLSAYAWRQGRLLPEGIFENGENGQAQFGDYLRQHARKPISLLANVAEEGHALETIPFLRSNDRQALISRKIGQHFLGTPLATAFSLGFEKTRRKNEKLLLSALTNPAHFEPWLNRIAAAEAPLAGIYTIAQLGGQLLRKLGQETRRCLLLTQQDSSIRESYLVDGRTLFSRMAPLGDSSIAGLASSFTAEAGKLHQYLIGQRLIGRDEPLPAYIMAHPQAIPAIEKACPERGHLQFSIIDSHVAARRIGLRSLPEDSRCDLLFLHLLATAPPRQQFAAEAHRHDYRLAQIRQGLLAAGLIALLGSLLYVAKEGYETYELRRESRELRASEADLAWRYQEISATFPQLGIDNDTLRRVTTRHAELLRQQRQPGPAYRLVGQALGQAPAVILEGLDWQIGRKTQAAPNSSVESVSGEEITTVRGAIRPEANATPRQILARFEAFVELLRAEPECTVNILQQPFDLQSERSLRGGDTEDAISQPRRFTVEVIRKLAP